MQQKNHHQYPKNFKDNRITMTVNVINWHATWINVLFLPPLRSWTRSPMPVNKTNVRTGKSEM